MKVKNICLFLVVLLLGFLAGASFEHRSRVSASTDEAIGLTPKAAARTPTTFTATATVTLTLGSSTVDQATANALRAAVLLDYCKAKGLDQSSPGASVDADVKALLKSTVVGYRADQAGATQRAIDTAAIQP